MVFTSSASFAGYHLLRFARELDVQELWYAVPLTEVNGMANTFGERCHLESSWNDSCWEFGSPVMTTAAAAV